MKTMVTGLLYTRDSAWATRIQGFLSAHATLLLLEEPAHLNVALQQREGTLLLIDLHTEGALDYLRSRAADEARTLGIAFGIPGSDPFFEAAQLGAYAVEDRQIDRQKLCALFDRAAEYLSMSRENRSLREESARLAILASAPPPRSSEESIPCFDAREFSRSLRHFRNVDTLLQRLADDVVASTGVARSGIFCRTRDQETYRLRAGVRCLETTSALKYKENDPLVAWLKVYAHVVSRANLEHISEVKERQMLSAILDDYGAEALVPLQSRDSLLGWLFVGKLSAGLPFEASHIDNLIAIAECVSTTLENALLYEEVAVQKTLAETLLHAMPTGIIAVDADGVVRWCNTAALTTLALDGVLGHPVETLDSRLADVVRRTLGPAGERQFAEWKDSAGQRTFMVRTQRLENRTECLGAVVVVQDTTEQLSLKEKEERLERATFWAELAAGMSHEIRNPLVAIKTFSQLLPERYDDAEFRSEFSEMVSREVDRLNSIIDQINDFAHPLALRFHSLNILPCIKKSVSAVFPDSRSNPIKIILEASEAFPRISGDEHALIDAFSHILRNASEALQKQAQPVITVILKTTRHAARTSIEITFKDNGPGISADLLPKVFSPFCTTKARGLGLGLPIAQRTILDHNGKLTLFSNPLGTCVTILLPAMEEDAPEHHETHSHR